MYVEVRISSCHFNKRMRMRMRHNVSRQQWMRRDVTVCAQAATGQEQQPKQPKPTFVQLIPITGEAQFDEVLESDKPVIIDWCLPSFPSFCLPFFFSPRLVVCEWLFRPTGPSSRSFIIGGLCSYMLYHEMPEFMHWKAWLLAFHFHPWLEYLCKPMLNCMLMFSRLYGSATLEKICKALHTSEEDKRTLESGRCGIC